MKATLALALIVLVAFVIWWNDPSFVAEREARAWRVAAAQARAVEADAQWSATLTPILIGSAAALIIAAAGAGVACLMQLPLILRRRATSWQPDDYGMVPLSDAQRDRAAIALAEGHQDVRRLAASAPHLTQINHAPVPHAEIAE